MTRLFYRIFIRPALRKCRWIRMLIPAGLFFSLIQPELQGGISLIQSFQESNELGTTGFGYAVSSAGDMNNDGYDDLVVGVPYYSSGRGKAVIYFGEPIFVSESEDENEAAVRIEDAINEAERLAESELKGI